MNAPDGELVIQAAGQLVSGWQGISITRGVERCPSDFTVSASARLPSETRSPIPVGAPLQVHIGGHVVLTGYLERITVRLSAEAHEVSLSGRGRLCDLVDCSAIISPGNTANVSSIGSLARLLVAPFAGPIDVVTPDGDGDGKAYAMTINLSESPYEMLDRMARYEGLLVYEDADGNLVLARVGTLVHASGFVEGQNIQTAEYLETADERFSSYIPQLMSSEFMGGRLGTGLDTSQAVPDPEVARYRPRIVISEQAGTGGVGFLAEQRAAWEALRRAGRSLRLVVTADSWLDSTGRPWTPNMLAPVAIPSIGLTQRNWIITEVVYRRDGSSGTTCQVTLMPPSALTVEPQGLQGLGARLNAPAAADPVGPAAAPVAPITTPNAGPEPNFRIGGPI